ncbi:MAG: hydroxymethylpyrimidine/phosphomethylpyrimidine kinase [Bacteroidetes bacterium]|nr:MAG: hydroxymethylpyrimidine/phosphomethylpyrimidine kinase [Bacteroidota bacterium]
MQAKKHVLSIAGLDPSAGAGILSDIKTFEAHKVFGLGVCSCITFQNELKINGVSWISAEEIIKQLEPLFAQYLIDYVKIGLIQNGSTLENLTNYLLKKNPKIKIMWDPILQASSGFIFHDGFERIFLYELSQKLFLITPNTQEITRLMPDESTAGACEKLSKYCSVLLKGGHTTEEDCTDQLYTKGIITNIKSKRLQSEKHGTGCVLSSSITANLANGLTLEDACTSAKQYVFKFLESDPGLVGQHSYENAKIYS